MADISMQVLAWFLEIVKLTLISNIFECGSNVLCPNVLYIFPLVIRTAGLSTSKYRVETRFQSSNTIARKTTPIGRIF